MITNKKGIGRTSLGDGNVNFDNAIHVTQVQSRPVKVNLFVHRNITYFLPAEIEFSVHTDLETSS